MNVLGTPVSWLFVPGDKPERFEKAAAAGADEIVLDLEDAVAVSAKPAARQAIADWLAAGGTGWVRINDVHTPYFGDDMDAVMASRLSEGLRGLVVPKATSDAIERTSSRTGQSLPLVALIETAEGLLDAAHIAQHRDVATLAVGTIDLAADLLCDEEWEPLLHARSTLVVAARAAGLPGPIDGVHADIRDPEGTQNHASRARALGFSGKLCIHPNQIASVHAAFAPTAQQVAWATRIADAVGGRDNLDDDESLSRVLVVGGEMVDKPVLRRVRRILQH